MSEQDVQVAPVVPESDVAPVQSETAPANPEPNQAPSDSKPDWFMADKYKTIEDQAKAQYEMQTLIGKMGRNWGPPKEEYTLEGIEGINPNDPVVKKILPVFKEMGVSQEGVSNLIKNFTKAQIESITELESSLRETLTKEDAAAIQSVDAKIDERFPPEQRAIVRSWINSKEDFYILNDLLSTSGTKSAVPSMMGNNAVQFESRDDVVADRVKYNREVKAGLRVPDENHEKQLTQRLRDAIARELRAKN